jgi:hypothetical protein
MRIAYDEEEESIVVISAYSTSKVRKYLRSKMKISFDPKYDVLYLKFSEDKIADTVEVDGGVLMITGREVRWLE